MKLNVLDVYLDRKDNTVSFILSKKDLAKLLFKKMAIDPKSVIKVDNSGFGKILIEFASNVNLETMTNLSIFDIRNGLRTKFYRPRHHKDTLVTINWLDIETPGSLVSHVLGHFGKLKSNVQWTRFKKEENESSAFSAVKDRFGWRSTNPFLHMLSSMGKRLKSIILDKDEPVPGVKNGRSLSWKL